MPRKFVFFAVLGLALALAACAPAATPTPIPLANQGGNGGNFGNGGNGRQALNAETKLAIGILKLEGTSNAVTVEEAKTLLPLWQQIKTMDADPNTAVADIQAVYNQIQGDLTADQTTAIDQMNLTQADMQAMMQQLGITFPQGGNFNGGTPFPQGGNNGGTPFPTLSPDERATRTAQRATQVAGGGGNAGGYPAPNGTPGAGFRGGGGGFGNVFIDPVITLLQTRSGG